MKRLVILLACAALACNQSVAKHQVTGVVELDGEPVKEGDMTFVPKDKDLHPEGARIQDGKFSVAIASGSYSVKMNIPKKVPLLPGEDSAYGEKEKTINVAAHYDDENPLTAEIDGPKKIDYKLKSKKD